MLQVAITNIRFGDPDPSRKTRVHDRMIDIAPQLSVDLLCET